MVDVTFSTLFQKAFKKLDSTQKIRLQKSIQKILQNPHVGKPLRHNLCGERSVRIKPYRIIYTYLRERNLIFLQKFEHRDSVYE
jgi:mRNA-degrading endonuclease RelE of RelBE toxin-antitoxin system